jgi:hypothetical protein
MIFQMAINTIHITKFGYDKMRKIYFTLLCIGFVATAQTGIGTTAPVNKLQVEATTADPATSGAAANGNLRLSGTGATHVLDFGLSSSSTNSWLQARSKSAYGTYYNLLLNPNGGFVGIGTTAPSNTLTVGNAAGTIGGEMLLNPTSTQYEGGQIIFKRSLVGSTVDWTIDQYGTTSANARLRLFSGTTETNGINILENGNVGIKNSAPTKALDVTGDVAISGNLTGGNVATSKISGFVSNVSAETVGRTIALTDNGLILRYTGTTAATFTLPAAGTLPEGFNCMVLQASTGQITFGGTFYNRNSFTKTAGQYAIATVLYVGGVYIVSGEMSN